MGKIRVMVVDDSMFMRKVITDLLASNSEIIVVGTARNGEDALDAIPKLKPDVITLDIEMPKMDGLTALKKIMSTKPIPVVMLSALTQEGAEQTFEALDIGAVDYLPKPSGSTSLNLGSVREELIRKIKTASRAKLSLYEKKSVRKAVKKRIEPTNFKSGSVINIGSSTGGPQAVDEVFSRLPRGVPPIILVQHMPKYFTKPFAERLDKLSAFDVKEAEEGDRVEAGRALIAPGDFHMVVTNTGKIHLHQGPTVHFLRPTVDEMMLSAAKVYGSRNLGILLTGMGRDGANGMKAIKRRGGQTIAQDEASCVVFGMPKVAIDEGSVDVVLPLYRIPREIVRRCQA
jgi:two-component system chemotaxis response regulator CheB